jgi:hypothetical protein
MKSDRTAYQSKYLSTLYVIVITRNFIYWLLIIIQTVVDINDPKQSYEL